MSSPARPSATGKKIHYQMREQAPRDAADGLLQAP